MRHRPFSDFSKQFNFTHGELVSVFEPRKYVPTLNLSTCVSTKYSNVKYLIPHWSYKIATSLVVEKGGQEAYL